MAAEYCINNEILQQVMIMFSKTLSQSIATLITQSNSWEKHKAVGINDLCAIFGMERSSVLELCRKRDSPAFKIGGKTSPWMCFPEEMYKYLLKRTEGFKS